MKKHALVLFALLSISGLIPLLKVQIVKSETIVVPDEFSSIQAAINNASVGDTIFVRAGTYNEVVVVNQSVSLIGENRVTTIINETKEIGDGDLVTIKANGVLISNFTLKGHKEPEPTPPPSYWVDGCGILNEGYNNTAIVNIDLTNGGNANAMLITDAHNVSLIGNEVYGNIYGIILRSCSNIFLKNNQIRDNWGYTGWTQVRSGQGLYLDRCTNATLRGNILRENGDDFCINGEQLEHFLHDIDTSNLQLDGTVRTLYYLVNQHDLTINPTNHPDLGFLALVNSTNIRVEGFRNLSDNTPAILLAYTNNTLVMNNTIRYCTQGISLVHSSNNTIIRNTFAPNNTNSIKLQYFSSNNTITDNAIFDNTDQALYLSNSSRNIIANNNITNNGDGIYMVYSDNNKLNNNNVTNSGQGLVISYSCNSTLRENVMNNNSVNFRVIAYFDTNLFQFTHNVDPSNLVDGRHIYYLINYTGITVDPINYPDAGFVALVNSSNIAAQDLELEGMLLGYTNNTMIRHNTLVDGADSITMVKSSHNQITGNNVTDNTYGISLYDYSKNNTINRNNVTDILDDGISLRWHCENNTITGNRVMNSDAGISVDDDSSNIIITRNHVTGNDFGGIEVEWDSSFCTIAENNATGNHYGIKLSGNSNNTIVDNYVAGSEYDGIRIDNSANNTIARNYIKDSIHAGIALRYDSSNNTIAGNDIRNSTSYGIQFYIMPANNTVVGNNIIDSGINGIHIEWSSYHLITGNNITNSTSDGIHIEGYFYNEEWIVFASVHNQITGNNVALSGDNGIFIEASCNNVSQNEIVESVNNGIYIRDSSEIYVWNNTIRQNSVGVMLENVSDSKIWHNKFINNINQVNVTMGTGAQWDDGYPSGGNYWSDYTDVDLNSGPFQNITGSDGIWDHPNQIDENNIDNYPIVPEFPSALTMPLLVIATFAVVLICRRERTHTSKENEEKP